MTPKSMLGIVAIFSITTILIVFQGMTSTTSAEVSYGHRHFVDLTLPEVPNYKEDTIGDVKIRANFHFNLEGLETVDSFRIFNQLGGYAPGSTISFQLLGGVGDDKPKLYTATDMTHAKGFLTTDTDYSEFDVDVYLFKRGDEVAFRHFMYQDCRITDYSVATLHDGDETFSGKTKFVLADAFSFECKGFHPHSPTAILSHDDVEKPSAKTTSSMDLRNTQTWEDIFRPK